MKKQNGYWVDLDNNMWNCNSFTEEQAEKNSKTLINCSDCSGCSGCSDCSRCSGCSDCSVCSHSSGCFDCSVCSDCFDCSGCYGCSDCSDCSYCYDCSDYKSNPERYCKELNGSITKLAQAYWITGDDLQIVFGCYKTSDLEDFIKKAIKMNGGEKAKPFIKFAETVEYLIQNK